MFTKALHNVPNTTLHWSYYPVEYLAIHIIITSQSQCDKSERPKKSTSIWATKMCMIPYFELIFNMPWHCWTPHVASYHISTETTSSFHMPPSPPSLHPFSSLTHPSPTKKSKCSTQTRWISIMMWDPICFDLPEWKSSLVTCENFSTVRISPTLPSLRHCLYLSNMWHIPDIWIMLTSWLTIANFLHCHIFTFESHSKTST